jgi:4'-phosphopantetheinyl transferase
MLNVLKPNEIHIWWARTDSQEWDLSQLTSILAVEEKKRADRFHFPQHRRRFIITHGLLRSILGTYLNTEPDSLRFLYDPKGKPYLETGGNTSKIQFNLSHSNEIVLIGLVLKQRIGVDVEFIRPLSNLESIAGRYFSESELSSILNKPVDQREDIFFQYWTMKEAYLKAIGKGISGLRKIQIPHIDISMPMSDSIVNNEANQKWRLQQLQIDPCYASAFAIEGNDFIKPVLREWSSSFGK